MAHLANQTAPKMTYAQMEAALADANAKLSEKRNTTISFKVSEAKAERVENGKKKPATKGGGLIVYGLGRFPTTLYAAQWQRLAAEMPALLAFIDSHKDQLAWKED